MEKTAMGGDFRARRTTSGARAKAMKPNRDPEVHIAFEII